MKEKVIGIECVKKMIALGQFYRRTFHRQFSKWWTSMVFTIFSSKSDNCGFLILLHLRNFVTAGPRWTFAAFVGISKPASTRRVQFISLACSNATGHSEPVTVKSSYYWIEPLMVIPVEASARRSCDVAEKALMLMHKKSLWFSCWIFWTCDSFQKTQLKSNSSYQSETAGKMSSLVNRQWIISIHWWNWIIAVDLRIAALSKLEKYYLYSLGLACRDGWCRTDHYTTQGTNRLGDSATTVQSNPAY
jgi:hypothetical protein